MALLAIAYFIIVLAIKLAYDIRLYHGRQNVDHSKEAAIVIVALIPCAIILHKEMNIDILLSVPIIFFALFFNFWNLFDGLYNLLRSYKWFFTGSNDKDDAVLDNVLQKLPLWAHIILKIGGSALFTTLLILLKK